MIGVHQNEFTNSLEQYKQKLLVEIQKMTIDLSYVIDKRLENEEEKNKILDKIKAVNEASSRECKEESKPNDQTGKEKNGQIGKPNDQNGKEKNGKEKNGQSENGSGRGSKEEKNGSNREDANRAKKWAADQRVQNNSIKFIIRIRLKSILNFMVKRGEWTISKVIVKVVIQK